jgi:hypothetical protein
VYRPDVFAVGACAGYYTGFSVWVATTSTQPLDVVYEGPYGPIYLEGQH